MARPRSVKPESGERPRRPRKRPPPEIVEFADSFGEVAARRNHCRCRTRQEEAGYSDILKPLGSRKYRFLVRYASDATCQESTPGQCHYRYFAYVVLEEEVPGPPPRWVFSTAGSMLMYSLEIRGDIKQKTGSKAEKVGWDFGFDGIAPQKEPVEVAVVVALSTKPDIEIEITGTAPPTPIHSALHRLHEWLWKCWKLKFLQRASFSLSGTLVAS